VFNFWGYVMRQTQDMLNWISSPRYIAAKKIFDDILHKRTPNHETLVFLHGEKVAKNVAKSIMRFYNDSEFMSGTLREHDLEAPTLLSDMRKMIDSDDDFCAIDEYFCSQIKRNEDIDFLVDEIDSEVGEHFRNKFGPYALYAIKASALAVHHQLRRKSDVSSVSHWTGTAGIMHFLQATGNIPKHSDPYFRIIVAFLHDFNEDLPRLALHKDGKPYGFHRIAELNNDVLPKNELVIRDLNILTNLYSEMAKHVYFLFKKDGILFTVEGFQKFLIESMVKEKRSNPTLCAVYETLYTLVAENENSYNTLSGQELLNGISWDSYNFYVNNIISESLKYHDDTPMIVKFCDQNYNFIGKEVVSASDLIKNLLKVWLWASQVDSSPEGFEHTRDFLRELLEDDLCYCEYYIIRDMIRRESVLAYYAAAFQKIKRLSPVLYIDKRELARF
jgi:hypothetical protein